MDIKLHKLARTTPATRRYIQTAPKSAATLARELGVALTNKWKRAGRVHDGSHVRHHLHASTSPEQEALPQLRLSLDDVTEVMNRCSPTRLSRSAIHRCLVRLGLARLPAAPQAPAVVGRFAATPCGYIHLDLKVLTKLQKRPSYVLVAIDQRHPVCLGESAAPAHRRHGDPGRGRVFGRVSAPSPHHPDG